MRSLSIRLRLTLCYSAVLMLGLSLFGYGMWLALQQRLIAGVDGRLERQAEGLRLALEAEDLAANPGPFHEEIAECVKGMPAGAVIQFRAHTGQLILEPADQRPLPPFRAQREPYYRTVEREGRLFRAFATFLQQDGQTSNLILAIPLDEVHTVLRDFRGLLFMMVPGVVAAACLGGWWVSRRALTPVDEITEAARTITAQNLSKRLVVPQTGDELQRMSETWNQALERLETALQRIRRFTADASHELRTPVALIQATAELALRREREAEEYRQSLRQIQVEAEHMTQLTNALLSLATADANAVEMPLAPIDLNRLAGELVRQNQALADSRGIQLRADLSARPSVAPGHEAGVRRLIQILLDNALKFTPAGGAVLVSTARVEDGIAACVRDSGPGIPAEALPRIFERFYSAGLSHSENGGAGLGLSIAQTIAKAHGSSIRVESSPGAGSCFCFTLRF